eukprot:CAMPEP_0182846698 /NCGR_PEP_ID=MMETSP0006_2-20121128/28044_1 /TAXON_ID=97485 /ORGANISM="Prymnesium parvum, Strain Texoma1" /LENGTH=96 /DNA_ID=CAMNT_0024976943 /DNA_START=1027 /DNA_END=1318 /DNA_ORIENTATION=-
MARGRQAAAAAAAAAGVAAAEQAADGAGVRPSRPASGLTTSADFAFFVSGGRKLVDAARRRVRHVGPGRRSGFDDEAWSTSFNDAGFDNAFAPEAG